MDGNCRNDYFGAGVPSPSACGAGGQRGDGEEHPFCLPSLPPLTVPASLKLRGGDRVCVYKEWAAGGRAWRSYELGTSGSEGRGEGLSEASRAQRRGRNSKPGGKSSFLSGAVCRVCAKSLQLCLRLTPWTTACQDSLSFTISRSLLKLKSIELVMPFNHLILCRPLLLLPSIFPSIRVFSNESVLHIRWLKY